MLKRLAIVAVCGAVWSATAQAQGLGVGVGTKGNTYTIATLPLFDPNLGTLTSVGIYASEEVDAGVARPQGTFPALDLPYSMDTAFPFGGCTMVGDEVFAAGSPLGNITASCSFSETLTGSDVNEFVGAPGGSSIVISPYSVPPEPTVGELLSKSVEFFSLSVGYSYLPAGSSVPEPATWAMLLLGFCGIGIAMRREGSSDLLAIKSRT